MQASSFLKHQVIYDFSLPLEVTTSITTLTAKLLIACTPNGAISYISSLYVGSISDVELTRVSGLISKLPRNESASVMADRGFTIQDQLNEVGVLLSRWPEAVIIQQSPKGLYYCIPANTCGENNWES